MDRELTLRCIEALETYQRLIVLPWRMVKDEQLVKDLRATVVENPPPHGNP